MFRPFASRPIVLLFAVVVVSVAACTSDERPPAASPREPARTIPQPPEPPDLATAPADDRVDMRIPTFSDPTTITNPLFPVSSQRSVLMLGHVDGLPFRAEVTLLPYTRIVEWEGQRVETSVSQYNAFLDGRIEEIAYDYYAQADDGSVWYFGEDVFDFRDGAIIVTEGTWLAGRDGPAAMIMPANPNLGDVYRPENAPPLVFEEVTVTSISETLAGPLDPIPGGMVARELHMDGATEDKIFAPGYGEFFTSDRKDVEALALAVPTDAAEGEMPQELAELSDGAIRAVDAAVSGRWMSLAGETASISAAWEALRATGEIPRRLEPVMADAVRNLTAPVADRRRSDVGRASIEVARLAFDIQLRYRPVVEIELARLDLWAAQLMLDGASGDMEAVGADAYAIDYLRDRLVDLDPDDLRRLDEQLGAIQVAVLDEEPDAAVEAGERLRSTVEDIATATP